MLAKGSCFPGKVGPPQRDGHDFRAARFERIAHQFVRGEFARADEQSRSEFAIGNAQLRRFVRHDYKLTISCTTANFGATKTAVIRA